MDGKELLMRELEDGISIDQYVSAHRLMDCTVW
jgi:hypothetical protein